MALAPILCVGTAIADVTEPFPGVRLDLEEKYVEFDGTVPIVLTDPDMPDVYLEVIVCIPDTKEHETLVVTSVKPSHVHAALLLLGLEPGEPGSWTFEGEGVDGVWRPHDPKGDEVKVEFTYTDAEGVEHTVSPSAWVRHMETHEPLPDLTFVFAGSRMVDRGYGGPRYDSDGTGLLIGLATFGSETIAWPRTFSPDSQMDEPVWVADPNTTPPFDTAVRVRIRPAE